MSSSSSSAPKRAFKRKYTLPESSSAGASSASSDQPHKKSKVLTAADRKSLRKQRRAQKPNAELIERATELYKYSLTRMKADERKAKIDELIGQCSGKLSELACKHSVSRVLQLCVKYGSSDQREQIQRQLDGKISSLVTNHYGHHLILKLLQYHEKRARAQCLQELSGQFQSLAGSADAIKVLDYLFASSKSPKEQHKILAEFYSNDFSLGVEVPALLPAQPSQPAVANSLGSVLAGASLTRRTAVLDHLKQFLNRCCSKKLLMFRFVHALALNYWLNVDGSVRSELLSELEGNYLPLTSDSLGSRLLVEMIESGAAKDRKKILKELKPAVVELAQSSEAYFVLLAAIHCVDDSVQLNKFLESIFQSPDQLIQLAKHPHAVRVLLLCVTEPSRWSQTLNAFDWQIIKQQPANSKKDAALKQNELLADRLQTILTALTQQPDVIQQLIETASAANLLQEAILTAANIVHAVGEQEKSITAALLNQRQAIAALLGTAFDCLFQLVTARPSLLAHVNGHYLFKRLIKSLPLPERCSLASRIIDCCADSSVMLEFASESRSAFVLNELHKSAQEEGMEEIRYLLTKAEAKAKLKDKLIEVMKQAEKKVDDKQANQKKKKGENKKAEEDGEEPQKNSCFTGCKILLETLSQSKNQNQNEKTKENGQGKAKAAKKK